MASKAATSSRATVAEEDTAAATAASSIRRLLGMSFNAISCRVVLTSSCSLRVLDIFPIRVVFPLLAVPQRRAVFLPRPSSLPAFLPTPIPQLSLLSSFSYLHSSVVRPWQITGFGHHNPACTCTISVSRLLPVTPRCSRSCSLTMRCGWVSSFT